MKFKTESIALAHTPSNGLTTHVEKRAPADEHGVVVVNMALEDGRRVRLELSADEALTLGLSLVSCSALAANRLPTVLVPEKALPSALRGH